MVPDEALARRSSPESADSPGARAERRWRTAPVPTEFEFVEGWGMAAGAQSRVLRPRSVEEVARAFGLAEEAGRSLGLRGAGCSYGDANFNAGGDVLDLSRMDRILAWDAEAGVAELEPGATIQGLWRHILPDGWWPRVVPGTMFPTVAGCAAMNIHGKNNYKVGTFGEAVLEFDLLSPSGQLLTCSPAHNADLYYAAIGGFGMLGAITRLKLQTKKVYSGDIRVRAESTRNLREMMDYIEANTGVADYLVGWIDCFGKGDQLGRGLIHDGRYLEPGEDPDPAATQSLDHQDLPERILGLVPKSEVWQVLRLFMNDPGVRLINAAKYLAGRVEGMGPDYLQSHAAFNFLLDYVPRWKWAYGRGGLIQYQSFLPVESAHAVYAELMERNQRAGLVPYLGVFKRHRPDPFWLTHAVDGWSFAMDFRVTAANRERLWKHCAELTEVVLAGGGKFYFAKDLVIGYQDMLRFLPGDRVEAFRSLKQRLDPTELLQTNLWRRVFRPAGG